MKFKNNLRFWLMNINIIPSKIYNVILKQNSPCTQDCLYFNLTKLKLGLILFNASAKHAEKDSKE